MNLGKKITDYSSSEEKEKKLVDDELDDTTGVNVQFDESDDDVNSFLNFEIFIFEPFSIRKFIF